MPVTPFHLGPAYFVKVAAPRRFSFRVFLLTQVIIDLESLYFIVKNEYPLHRILHTFVGAAVVAILCVYPGRTLLSGMSKLWNHVLGGIKALRLDENISYQSAIVGSGFGAFSHIMLDGLMHRDMKPFFPFSQVNYLLGLISYTQLHMFCVISGLLGFVVYALKRVKIKEGRS